MDTVEFDAAAAELRDLFDRVSALVPGDWEITSTGARECTLPDGSTGATSLLLGIGPAVPDADVVPTAERITTLLTEAGYPPVVTDRSPEGGPLVIEGRYPGEGADAAGFGITFGVGTNGSALDGQARCVPGDADEINGSR